MSADIGKLTFLDEARELLTEIEESLLALESSPDDSGEVARLFRAMHTIKGSGAMFGFDEVARVTHEVETVFDKVRSGSLPLTTDLLSLTLEAKDHIQGLLDVEDTSPFKERSDSLIARFRLAGGEAPPQAQASPTGEAEADGRRGISPENAKTYWVRYRPAPNTFLNGTNPLALLEELSGLGRIWIRYHDTDIPALEALDPELAYCWWDLLLVTDKGEDAIKDVFIFVEDEGGIAISLISDLAMRGGDSEELMNMIEASRDLGRAAVTDKLSTILASKMTLRGTGVGVVSAQRRSETQERAASSVQSSSIRVDGVRLDNLVNLVGELVIVQSRLSQAVLNKNQQSVRNIAEELQRLTSEMRDYALGIRMVPIGTMYSTLHRLVRDLSTSLGKRIEFVGEGADTELDKNVIDKLKDPLVHMLRNSVDHGIESPEKRLAAGKPENGTITLKAGHESGNVVITIQDDGGGIDAEAVRQKALDAGVIAPDAELTPKQIYDLLFLPGLSTAKTVSSVSGRGVGMDVVRKNIDALRGGITLDSAPGEGTTVTVRLPLTLAIIDGLQFRVGKEFFIIPLPMIQACQERRVTGAEKEVDVIEMRGDLIPCLSVRKMLNIPGSPPAYERIIIAGVDGSLVGLAVDAVVGQQQAVIKRLSRIYQDVNWVSGTTINGDGGISLILDVPHLVRFAAEHFKQFMNAQNQHASTLH
ncbi:chemotaxis protein CheA [Fundidesulfovibrio terrae]|uniref:chemotaxis protein CheA n=1 Tax=Fundidesulfovibrio terrae TaxID=2922866 RepID=UPI001FAF2BAA|nr:chemotaxis protein CheA [Fundidesulfovibrio terrae]